MRKILGLLSILIVIFIVSSEANVWSKSSSSFIDELYVSGERQYVRTYNNLNDLDEVLIPRGTLVSVIGDRTVFGKRFKEIEYQSSNEKTKGWIESDSLVEDLKFAALEKEVYVRTTTHIFDSMENGDFIEKALKGTKYQVLGAELDNDGNAKWYKLKNNEIEGYARGKYFVLAIDDALKRYSDLDPLYLVTSTRDTCSNCYGGSASNLDFFPRKKIKYSDNMMPEEVISWYIPMENLKNIDEYIKLAEGTKVNSFIVDIKDDQAPSYRADSMKEHSLKNYYNAMYSNHEFKKYTDKIKDNGYYLIGRITVFKDAYYAYDHPEYVISSIDGEPYEINRKLWPSPYQRSVWKFNVDLAKESIEKFGFDEINFDYIRFPDRTQSLIKDNIIDQKNTYQEDRAVAIQLFLMYAYDELSDMGVYMSGDVFGESSHTYVTDYGQYWSAMSNILDVISPMPYPDHFGNVYEGYEEVVKPWEHPYRILKVWGASAKRAQDETPTPAVVRSWILHQDTMQGFKYDTKHLQDQVNGLYENDLDGGYMPWTALGNLSNYKRYISLYK